MIMLNVVYEIVFKNPPGLCVARKAVDDRFRPVDYVPDINDPEPDDNDAGVHVP